MTGALTCAACGGPAVRVQQDGSLSCVGQCTETSPERALRAELEELTMTVSQACCGFIPKQYAFLFVLADVGRGGSMAYASSVARADAISMLREMADKLEKS